MDFWGLLKLHLRVRGFAKARFLVLSNAIDSEYYRVEAIAPCKSRAGRLEISVSEDVPSSSRTLGRLKDFLHAWWPLFDLYSQESPPLRRQWEFSGSDAGHPELLSMEGEDRRRVIPDLYAIELSRQTNRPRWNSLTEFRQTYFQRRPIVFWRGSTTGFMRGRSPEELLLSNRRVAVCRAMRALGPQFDMGISRVTTQAGLNRAKGVTVLRDLGVFEPEVPESDFMGSRYFPSLPGNAQPWGSLRKMLQGNLIFASSTNKKLLYQFELRQGEHYLQVKDDFSDLPLLKDWADTNPDVASGIAYEGALAAQRYLDALGERMATTLKECGTSVLAV